MAFGKFSKKSIVNKERVFLGAPEAEAEALPNSRMPLTIVYHDYSNLAYELDSEKFIVLGRKGSGKSAFAEYICHLSKSEPNTFAKFIRKSEANLEAIVQIGEDNGHSIEVENLYTWLILVNILKLFSDNQAIKNNKEYVHLEKFLSKNSGFVDIRKSEIKEIIETKGMEVSTEYFKRFFNLVMNKKFDIKQERAQFYKLIPHLKEVLLKVLKSEEELKNGNSYVLFFDDLDIISDIKDERTKNSLLSLIRVSKEINNELFSKNNLDSKVVLLLRDDISKYLSSIASDSSKIFSSYSILINWYQDGYHQNNSELDLNIRKFINKRIEYVFNHQELAVNVDDPWLSLVEDPFNEVNDANRSSFKYILDHTFFRPRDLLLFFQPLAQHNYDFPLSKYSINQLIGKYCTEVVNELKNEFSCFYSINQIAMIFNAFMEMNDNLSHHNISSIPYEKAIEIIDNHCKDVDAKILIEDMFYRSLIGNMKDNGHVFFKHREPSNDTYKFNKSYGIIMHNALKVYCKSLS